MTLQVATAGTGVVRDNHWVTPTGASAPIRTLLLEPQRTNLCIRSEEFDTWSSVNVTVTANASVAPDGTATADLLTSTTGSTDYVSRSPTFTGNGEKAFSLYVKAGTATSSVIQIRDTTAVVNRHLVAVTWTAGVPSLSTGDGAGTLYPVVALSNGWYRISFSATGIVAANSTDIRIRPGVGTMYAWGAQAEDAVVPSSYIPTAGTTVTRNADSLYWSVPSLDPPREMTVYHRYVEQGTQLQFAASPRLWQIGDPANINPRLTLFPTSSTALRVFVHNGTSSVVSDSTVSPTMGDIIETRAVLAASGAVTLGATKNGAAEVVGTASGINAMPGAWSAPRLYLSSIGASFVSESATTHVAIAVGTKTRAEMRAIAGVP